jgi:hypothetical protein
MGLNRERAVELYEALIEALVECGVFGAVDPRPVTGNTE